MKDVLAHGQLARLLPHLPPQRPARGRPEVEKEATSYAERYEAKPEGFPAGSRTGRVWGLWSGQLLPARWETVEVALPDAFRIRRIYRKLARRKDGGPCAGSRCS